MKLVIQRVSKADVIIDGEQGPSIEKGFVLFLGVGPHDNSTDLNLLVKKMLSLRVFEDKQGKMNESIKDVSGSLLVISQFTLYANCKKGNRPSFTDAGAPDLAKELYLAFLQECRNNGIHTEEGKFGADMKVSLTNDGPVTILLDSESLRK